MKETAATVRVTQSPPSDVGLLSEIAADIRDRAERRENPLGAFRLTGGAMAGQMVLDEVRAVDEVLRAKATPEEQEAYRAWLLAAARASAEAAKEGGFLGFGAEQVSRGEEEMLERLRDTLGMQTQPRPR